MRYINLLTYLLTFSLWVGCY